MPMKRYKPEQIVNLLRQIEVEIANGKTTPQACKEAAIRVGYQAQHCCDGAAPPNTTTVYYHGDHLGSQRLMTGYDGYPTWSATYLPFGQEWNPETTVNHYKFTGKERDSESGLDNFGARYDSSQYGRFMSPHPSNLSVDFWLPQTWNRYSYVLNNPLQMVDRNGLWPTSIHNEIVNEAFPGLSSDQLKTLQQSSYNVDHNPVNGVDAQDPSLAYMHGMSNGMSLQNPQTAEQMGNDFIAQNEHDAQKIQADWIASGHTGIAPGALAASGNALHTITDRTSPAHAGNQPWFGADDPLGALMHALRERSINSKQMDTATGAARNAFLDTFGFMELMRVTQQQEVVTHRFLFNCRQDEGTGASECN